MGLFLALETKEKRKSLAKTLNDVREQEEKQHKLEMSELDSQLQDSQKTIEKLGLEYSSVLNDKERALKKQQEKIKEQQERIKENIEKQKEDLKEQQEKIKQNLENVENKMSTKVQNNTSLNQDSESISVGFENPILMIGKAFAKII